VLAADCADPTVVLQLAACQKQAKSSTPVTCVSQPQAGLFTNLGTLTFRFPDTTALHAPAGLAGPATIALTRRSAENPMSGGSF
jgi:hypothetical protein